MSGPDLAWFLAGAFGAEIIGTMAGFGAATILTPVAMLFLSPRTAIAMVAWFHLFGNAARLVFFGRRVSWRIWWQFGLTGVSCSLVGAAVTARLSASALQVAFGVFLLAYVATDVLVGERARMPATPATLVAGGVASGFIAGLLGTGGAIRSACLLSFGLPKEAYIGTSAAIALIVDATRLPVYLAEGFVPSSLALVAVSLILVAFAGSWVGQRLVRRLRPAAFRTVVLTLLAAMGLKLLLQGGA